MPARRLSKQWTFPDPNQADADGLVAYGGDLHPRRLVAAYAQGIFPWPHRADWPMLWFSPDPRMVLAPANLYVNRSLQKTLRKRLFEVRLDTAFAEVMHHCATTPRPEQQGTWITRDMIRAYCALHELGLAHSVESWAEGRLVGGLYGVSLGTAFFGESMFAHRSDASKVAFVHLARQLQTWNFHFLDCQVHTPHVEHLGATLWPRRQFLRVLAQALQNPTRQGPWSFNTDTELLQNGNPR